MKRAEIETCLGEPDRVSAPDPEGDVHLCYDELGLDLCLDADDNFRLSMVEIRASSHSYVAGTTPIDGLSETAAKRLFTSLGVRFDSSETCAGEVAWSSSSSALSLYCEEGEVTGLSMSVPYDAGDEPKWPHPHS